MDCVDFLDNLIDSKIRVPLLFGDPPDNLGLDYDEYKDKMPSQDYYNWLDLILRKSLVVADCVWLSYYWEHDLEVKYRVRQLLRHERPSVKAKTFIWRYTFGQYVDRDCGSGFRYLLRLSKPGATFRPDAIRVVSRRMELGDPRAKGPKVPDDVWEFPRIVGNSPERKSWHPTQHPEDLIRRIVLFHSDPGHNVVDLFGGTGTMLRVCHPIGRCALISEISKNYCDNIIADNPDKVVTLYGQGGNT